MRIWFLEKWAVHLVSISGNMCGFIAFDRECAISYVIVSVSRNDSQGPWSWTCYCSRHGIRATLQAVTHHQETYASNGCTCHDVNKLCTIRRTSKAFYQFVKMKHLTCDRTLIGDRYRILSCCPSKETKRKKTVILALIGIRAPAAETSYWWFHLSSIWLDLSLRVKHDAEEHKTLVSLFSVRCTCCEHKRTFFGRFETVDLMTFRLLTLLPPCRSNVKQRTGNYCRPLGPTEACLDEAHWVNYQE